MNEKIYLLLILLVIAVAFLLTTVTTTVLAVYNTTDVDVNISSVSQITLIPNYLNWTQLVVGTAGGYKNISVRNTGSVNVTSIFGWVNTLELETTKPYGSSDPASYAAGGVLTLRNETDTKYYYLGRIEWNWTEDIPNHDWSAVGVSNVKSWGYFRNMSDDYVWVLGNGTVGLCNNTGAKFSIETDIDLGTSATRTPDNTFSLNPSSNDPKHWSYASITTSTLSGHCVAAYWDCSKVFIYNFDKRSNFTDCSNADYLYNSQLAPGSTVILRADAWIPRGIPAGNLTRSTITVEAT